jgi:hypothetical protein
MTGYPENSVRALLAESGITGPDTDELAGRLSALEQYVDDTPPEPSPQLAALMAGKATAAVVAPFSRRRGRVLVASLVAVGAVGAGGIAAAANELPAPAQDLVAELSERYLPFSLPRPAAPTVEEAPPAESGPDPVLPPPSPSWGLDDDESPRRDRLADPWTTAPADPMPTPKRSKAPEPSSSPTPSEDTSVVPEEPVVPTEPTEDPSVPDADEVTGDGTTSEEGAGGTDSTTGTGGADGTGTGTTGSADGSGGTGTTTASGGETSGGQASGTGTTAGGEPKGSPRTSSDPSPSAGRRRSDPPPKAEPHSRGKAKPRGTAVWSDL